MAELLFGPTPHEEAIKFLLKKPAVSREVFDQLLPELKALAFTITGIEDLSVQQSVLEKIATLPAGVPWDKAKKALVNQLHPYLDDAESGKKRSEARAELLLRTHGFQAYQAASYGVMDRQRDVFPYWQYKSMEDGKVRPAHAALDNIILPCHHEFWKTHFPPWQWNCRCQCVPLSQDDYEEIAIEDMKRAKDLRHILDDDAQQTLTDKRILVRNGVAYNVSSDAEKGKEGAYSWHPDNLRPDLTRLRQKYDAQTFAKFEAFAKAHKLEDGTTVWAWLRGQELKPKKPRVPRAPKPAPDPDAWPELTDLEKVKTLGGSTGAELMRHKSTGKLYVMKRGNSPEHVREEFAADEAYRALGAAVPRAKLYEQPGQPPTKLAEHIEGEQLGAWLQKATPAQAKTLKAKLGEHFAADALLGNWDVAGMGLDNILVDKAGVPWRIDNGGSLRFRAQGSQKTPEQWDGHVEELWTLRDPKANPQTAKLFGDLDIFSISKQIAAMDEAKLLAAVPADLHATLSERLANLRDIGRKAAEMQADQWKAGYVDDLTREMMGLRKAGLVKDLPQELKGAPGSVHLVDENGLAFDHLRTQKKATAQAAAAGDKYFNTFKDAAVTINAHHDKGDMAYNQAKLAAALQTEAELQLLAKSQDANQRALAQKYLGVLAEIKAAQGNAGAKVAQLTPYTPAAKKPKKAASTESLVTRLAAHMKVQGGDWKHVETWAVHQKGSSTSPGSMAYKRFLLDQLDGAKPGDFHRAPRPDAWETHVPAAERESYRRCMLIHHAFVQETLAHTAFPTNDQTLRKVRILRTETNRSAIPFAEGQTGQYKRGVNESGSLIAPIFSGAKTVTNVPHSRITSLYFLERDPGKGGSFLLGDGENEATYIGWGLETKRVAESYFNQSPGTDSTKWEI